MIKSTFIYLCFILIVFSSDLSFSIIFITTETTVPILLGVLCSNEMPPREHLETQQALFKQFAEILDFTLKFDDFKVA